MEIQLKIIFREVFRDVFREGCFRSVLECHWGVFRGVFRKVFREVFGGRFKLIVAVRVIHSMLLKRMFLASVVFRVGVVSPIRSAAVSDTKNWHAWGWVELRNVVLDDSWQ